MKIPGAETSVPQSIKPSVARSDVTTLTTPIIETEPVADFHSESVPVTAKVVADEMS